MSSEIKEREREQKGKRKRILYSTIKSLKTMHSFVLFKMIKTTSSDIFASGWQRKSDTKDSLPME